MSNDKTITETKMRTCPRCFGTGETQVDVTCQKCEGSGEIEKYIEEYKGWMIEVNEDIWSAHGDSFRFIIFQIGNEHESRKYVKSISEAKELIDEKQN